MVRLEDIELGDVVYVRGNFGMKDAVKVRVMDKHENVARGEPGISYIPISDFVFLKDPTDKRKWKWAYLEQVSFGPENPDFDF